MAAPFVLVRLPNRSTLLGELVARHPESRVSCVPAGMHVHGGRRIADHIVLVEGVPDRDLAEMLLAWRSRYGEAPQALGGPFALRLPMDLGLDHTGVEAACIRLGQVLPDPRQVVTPDGLEVWSPQPSPDAAHATLGRLRGLMAGMPVVWAGAAAPRRAELDAWEVLQGAAAAVVPDCLVATTT